MGGGGYVVLGWVGGAMSMSRGGGGGGCVMQGGLVGKQYTGTHGTVHTSTKP